jgi:predicted GIY-YIG superfamily endonuclease
VMSPFVILKAWVYILQSQISGRYYCGHSTDVERRIRQHNDPDYHLSGSSLLCVGNVVL